MFQLLVARICRGRPGDKNHPETGAETMLMVPDDLSQPAPHTVTHDRTADPP